MQQNDLLHPENYMTRSLLDNCSCFLDGNLRENDGTKDQYAAPELCGGQSFVKQQPAKQNGKNRFQTHNECGGSGLQMLLPDDLQGICNKAVEESVVDVYAEY